MDWRADGVYERLGLKRAVNAAGGMSRIGASLMPQEVVAAMVEASQAFVDLQLLHEAAGQAVASATGADAGMVCGGSTAGLLLATAACVTGNDPALVHRLPDLTGMRSEVAIHRLHRCPEDHAIRTVGVRLVEFGLARSVQPWELDEAITQRTACVAYISDPTLPGPALSLAHVVEIAHRRHVPVVVEASAALPPADNMRRFIREGADLVAIAGSLALRGPATAGILAGRRDLIAAALANVTADGVGRPTAVGKEEIVGIVAALDLYLKRNHHADLRWWRAQAEIVVGALSGITGVHAAVIQDGTEQPVPQAVISLLDEMRSATTTDLVTRLRSGDPPIYVRQTGPRELTVNPLMLQEGEAQYVGERLQALLH